MAGRVRADGGRRVVAIGDGTRLVVLSLLKHYLGSRVAELTAVVTVTDGGGSPGHLREELVSVEAVPVR